MRKKHFLSVVVVSFCILFSLGNNGCESGPRTQTSESGVKQTTDLYQVPVNSAGRSAEGQNIWDRLRVTTDFTKIMWLHIIALDGKIINRQIVRNKVTSSGKRLEPTIAGSSGPNGRDYPLYKDYETPEIMQPDGTFGSSDPYIFWFDPQGRYNQLGTSGGLGYLLTDYPIDLKNPIDEMTGLYNAELTALKYQKEQEAILQKIKEQDDLKKLK